MRFCLSTISYNGPLDRVSLRQEGKPVKWNKVTVKTKTDAEDIIIATLAEVGLQGAEIQDKKPLSEADKEAMFVGMMPDMPEDDGIAYLNFYVDEDQDLDAIVADARRELDELAEFMDIGDGTITTGETEDKDWINNWKTFFKPFRAADNIVIKPTWETYEKENEDDILIEIDPGIAFGTGSHETTKLCIQALDKYVKKGDSVLDVGCGSGILSIAALKLGAVHATAIDIDEVAVKVAAENMEVNHIPTSQYTLFDGDLITNSFLKVKAGTGHDIVVANILADVIIPLTGVIRPHLKKGGLYITSGIINTKEEEVREALTANGFEILGVEYMKEWCCFIAK